MFSVLEPRHLLVQTPAPSVHHAPSHLTKTIADFSINIAHAFQQAQQASGKTVEQRFGIGTDTVQLCCAGDRLATALTPALAHLAISSQIQSKPPLQPGIALTICGWEGAESQIALPALPCAVQQALEQRAAWGYYLHTERFALFFQPAAQMFSLLDYGENRAFYWVGNAQQLPLSEGGAPLLTLLHWWLGRQGRQVVHGAAVGTHAGGALLVGKSGSGKSTTALACLNAGLCYVGDDYCLIATKPEPTVYSVYSSGKVHFADLERFPRLQRAQTAAHYTDADKALYFFAHPFANQIVPSLPIKAILLPTISREATTRMVPVSPAAAMLAMAPSTVLQLVGAKAQTMQQISQLVRQVPCFQLALGTDLQAIPAVIAGVLDR